MSGVSFYNDDSNEALKTTDITIVITTTPLLQLLKDLLRALALSGTRRLSVTIKASASALPEEIVILAVLKLLRAEFGAQRVNLITVRSRLRSTIVNVEAFIQGENVVGLQRVDLHYNVDDVTLPPN